MKDQSKAHNAPPAGRFDPPEDDEHGPTRANGGAPHHGNSGLGWVPEEENPETPPPDPHGNETPPAQLT